jgi:hypothetical protein
VVVRRLVELYQRGVSPWLPFRCRFHPSCSRYFLEALERFGLARAMWLGLRRLLRCQPFCAGGYDPVPEKPTRDPRPPGQAT